MKGLDMGTRADFYVGEGVNAEWIASVGFDGYEWYEQRADQPLMAVTTPEGFREQVKHIGKDRNDFTTPERGWPWPWEDSRLTDFSYCFVDGRVDVYRYGSKIDLANDDSETNTDESKRTDWPNMSEKQNVTLGPESGLIVL